MNSHTHNPKDEPMFSARLAVSNISVGPEVCVATAQKNAHRNTLYQTKR